MKTIELIDKYEVRQSDEGDYNPPSYIWVDNTGELIRCKDCKYFTGKWCIVNSRKQFDPEDRLVDGNGFCAWAERRENG